MWDSEFEFEDDDCELDSFEADTKEANPEESSAQLSDKLRIENAYYEAEDVVLRDPALAAARFEELMTLLNTKLKGGGTPMIPLAALQKWQLKALQHLVKLPVLGPPERWTHFVRLLEVTHQVPWAESSGAITGALDAFEDAELRGVRSATPQIVIEAHEAAAGAAEKRNIVSGWRQIVLRLTHYLLRTGKISQAEHWLGALYRDWLRGAITTGTTAESTVADANASLPGSADLQLGDEIAGEIGLSHPIIFKAIHAASNEDSHLLEIIALDLERCEVQGLRLRASKLIGKCLSSGRAFLQKRTLMGVRRYVGKYHFLRGEYKEAYTAFYDAFEAVCSVGDVRRGRELLLSIMVCNLMSGSDIDPRTTREAHSLLNAGQADTLEIFRSEVDHIVAVDAAAKTKDVRAFQKLMSDPQGTFTTKDPMCVEADIAGELLMRVRREKLRDVLRLWETIDLEWLLKELAFVDRAECLCFLLQYFHRQRDVLAATFDTDFLRVHHYDYEQSTAQQLMLACQHLLLKLEPTILHVP